MPMDETQPQLPHDDLMDVFELTVKIENFVSETLAGYPNTLAVSALMSAVINALLAQCVSLNHVLFYRDIFVQTFDAAIKNLEIKNPE
jgi:hypothetical protein